MSIVRPTKYFRPYLYGKKFIILTDHRPLVWLMSLKDPNSKMLRWRIKLDEYNLEIKYKAGKLNSNADALSRLRPPFEIIKTRENIFDKNQNRVHCISDDKALSKGFAEQINSRFDCQNFLKGKREKVIPQPICKNKMLFHLVTKEKYYDKPMLETILDCLKELKEYCVNNEIYELHMPKICSGLDKFNFNIILEKIKQTFKETHIKIYIHERGNDINLNDNISILAQKDEEETNSDSDQTVDSDDENELNNIMFKEGSNNTGKNQIIISTHDGETEIKIKKLFRNSKQRLLVRLNKRDLNNEIKEFIKTYLAPKCKYLCLIDANLHLEIGKILMENFQKESYSHFYGLD